jgi:hypothetical protein
VDGLLAESQALIDNIVYHWDQLLIKRKFREHLRNAWGELRNVFDTVRGNIRQNYESLRSRLQEIGFEGYQGTLKLGTLTDIWSRFRENGVPFLKDLLEYLSVAFESLSEVFSPLKAVKELVDSVKWFLSPSKDWTDVAESFSFIHPLKPPEAAIKK